MDGLFTYGLPERFLNDAKPGRCVMVPFGLKSITHAYIVEPPRPFSELPEGLAPEKLKDVLEILDEEIFLPPDVLELCRWAHEYYRAPLGEVLQCAVPASSLKKAKSAQLEKEKTTSEMIPPFIQALTALQKEALQKLEVMRISPPLKPQFPKAALLHGVTGSGKTELYLELARRVLSEGKNVLVLVPEIALTPQLHQRFIQGLGQDVGLWHSALPEQKRITQAHLLRQGILRVVVGARSAVFSPIQNLGLMVIDEEHDPSFKQQDRVRYHARDLALVRAKITGAFIVLGSATPSLEARERVHENRFGLVTLSERPKAIPQPKVEIINLCSEEKAESLQAPFALKTLEAIRGDIAAGNQVMVFLNRRGFASFLVCKECGEVSGCKNCSISLTVHRKHRKLRCHVCSAEEQIPLFCTKCKGTSLEAVGAGTESLEEELPPLIPGAVPLRLDRDQVTSTKRLNAILNTFRDGYANLLLGTQMLVKGHDFPNVTLVVVVLADALFRWPDFRAPERAYQILTQVAGRAGRGEKRGRVLIQAFQVNNPVLKVVAGEISEKDFLETERQLRKILTYPPFGRLVRIRFENRVQAEAARRAKILAYQLLPLTQAKSLFLLGPSEAFLERAKGIYRWDLLLKSQDICILQQAIAVAKNICSQNKWQSLVDMDPCGM